jgi:predicted Zn-dependent protease
MRVIDAVIAHELAHITHKNHSKDFYQLLDSMISTKNSKTVLYITPKQRDKKVTAQLIAEFTEKQYLRHCPIYNIASGRNSSPNLR